MVSKNMQYTIAIEVGDKDHSFSVAVPDLPGCFSAGESMQDAINKAKEAIIGHLELLAEMGELPPEPKPLEHWKNSPDFIGWEWAVIEIQESPELILINPRRTHVSDQY